MGHPVASLDPVFEPGAMLCRRYRVDAALASGGMGTVYRGTHLALGHAVAIKVLHERALNDDALRRFAREARIAAHLSELSRNIVRVSDYGVERSRPFLVMELLRGEDLRERLERERRLPVETAVDLAAQLADALDVVHQEGIVHRDLKPANIFLARDRGSTVVKLMDFGVAQSGENTLRSGFVLGTPAFMSPEQIEGKPVDHRADLWSLGVIVYRMLTGVLPFGNGSTPEVGEAIVEAPHEPPSRHVHTLPRALDAWMARALSKDPRHRFASAPEMVSALRAALGIKLNGYPALGRNESGIRRQAPPHRWWLIAASIAIMLVALVVLIR